MGNLLENQNSNGQWVWVLFIRIIGTILLIAPLYLPIKAYFFTSIPNISLTTSDVIMCGVGLFVSAGGKQIGILLNNIGIAVSALLTKFSK